MSGGIGCIVAFDVQLRASSAVYLTMTSALSSWKSRSEIRMMSPWLIQTWDKSGQTTDAVHSHGRRTFFLIFPRMWANRFSPSKHCASRRPFPSILRTCAYSWPSSRNTSSRLSPSFSFFPRLRFFPPYKVQGQNEGRGSVVRAVLTFPLFCLTNTGSVFG